VNPWALDALGWKYYLVYCGWLSFELCFVLVMIVETKGRTLEETAVLFDGDPDPCLPADNPPSVTATRSFGLLAEVEDRLRYLASVERSKRKLTMTEFRQLEREKSVNSGPSTSGNVGPATSPRILQLETHRNTSRF